MIYIIQVSLDVSCIRDALLKYDILAVLVEPRFNAIDLYCIPARNPCF